MEVAEPSGAGNDTIALQADSLIQCCREDLAGLVSSVEERGHHALDVDVVALAHVNPEVAHAAVRDPRATLKSLDAAAARAQEQLIMGMLSELPDEKLSVKKRVHVRLHNLPFALDQSPSEWNPGIGGVRCRHAGKLLSFVGTITRMGEIKMLESRRDYQCEKCKHEFVVEANIDIGGAMQLPSICPSKRGDPCDGTSFKQLQGEQQLTDYQEIALQEKMQCMAMGSMPRSMKVILVDDLADSVKSGDDVEITGHIIRRWKSTIPGLRCDVELVLVANHIRMLNPQKATIDIDPETEAMFSAFWEANRNSPLKGRDELLSFICPQICGMFDVKLSLALTLIGGVHQRQDGMSIRGEIHMLLVGDPGMGKSQFLKYAALLSPRSVMTSGRATSSAGLTAAAVKDEGSWCLEAGAMVLADGGICCIDEFDGIKKADLATIHEAMEQQTLSIAKAGMVTTLSSRTSVLGVMNPKGCKFDPRKNMTDNTGLDGPLLSRFDILLVLTDMRNPQWDEAISGHILSSREKGSGTPAERKTKPSLSWSLDLLRKYIHWVKARFSPSLSAEANTVLLTYYRQVRQNEDRQSARMTIRMLESLVRLSQAHARLMARDSVQCQDAIVAVMLMESSAGPVGVTSLDSGFADDPDEEYIVQKKTVLQRLGLRHAPRGQEDDLRGFTREGGSFRQSDWL
ncbi:hypothetical protein BSKO_03306 [Bryopsis sp. KO-2023]|nr:hypothetical protein BSKO_03306 [Bryopsis sp. KO-2023]